MSANHKINNAEISFPNKPESGSFPVNDCSISFDKSNYEDEFAFYEKLNSNKFNLDRPRGTFTCYPDMRDSICEQIHNFSFILSLHGYYLPKITDDAWLSVFDHKPV